MCSSDLLSDFERLSLVRILSLMMSNVVDGDFNGGLPLRTLLGESVRGGTGDVDGEGERLAFENSSRVDMIRLLK